VACIYGGSPDTHRIIQSQKWIYYPGVQVHRVNARYKAAGRDAPWRRENLTVREESRITGDMVPPPGAFTFRLAARRRLLESELRDRSLVRAVSGLPPPAQPDDVRLRRHQRAARPAARRASGRRRSDLAR